MPKKPRISMDRQEAINGYLFFSPWLIGFFLFMAGPILYSLYLSFTSYNMLKPPRWIGFLNYKILFTEDPLFWKSLYNTLYFVFFSVPINIFFGVLIALLMNQKVRGIRVFRAIFYLPSIVTGVAVALLWQWLLDPNFGLINDGLAKLGIEGPGWLSDENWSKPSLILMNIWSVGGGMIVYLAGLQGVPKDLYEAATVDGAGKMKQFWRITLPMLSPTIFFNLVMGILGGFQVFIQAYIMTGGGPVNSTTFYALYLYNKAFKDLQMGYASAMAWVLMLITLIFTLIIIKTSRSWVYYEGAENK
ncbi:carbohydrate ABC transporter permease [Paenibacillus montanisoli]|uniref:ABC transporter permease n=1 Tax=Paenibacillus montanisoli TaxID=2081970 RepID=A0A328U2T1_9BACL|nr:sugar ABC transporter permease [Paenibacillus montanisoli]RAP74294.1 ABC transporter permease [Paenibacillus montanisoli]